MSRRALSLITAALVLVAATAATAASASKSVIPKLGFYEGPGGELPGVSATGVKVVKIGKRLGAEFEVSFDLTCPHSSGGKTLQAVFGWVEETPIPIKNGKFTFDRTIHSHVVVIGSSGRPEGSGPGTARLVVSGAFGSATKVVVEASATGSYEVHYFDEEQPSEKVACTGKQTATAKFKH